MAQPTRARQDLRLDVLKKVDPVSEPKSSSCTADSDSLTLIIDSLLAPGAESEDYVGDWIYIRSQAAAVDSTANINEGGQFSTSDVTLTVTDGTVFTVGDGIQFSATATASGEICRITAIATNDLTLVRAIQGTTATTHEDSDNVFIIGPTIGEIVRVTAVDFSSTNSKLTTAPDFSASPVDDQEYERHRKVKPNIINNRLDVILGLLRQNVLLPVTLITDGDMETSGTGDWTSSSATLGKSTAFVRRGRQSLSVQASGTPGLAKSAGVHLPPGTEVIVEADAYIPALDSTRLILVDATGIAPAFTELEVAKSDVTGWVHMEFRHTTGSSIETVQVWLEATTNSDIIYFDHVTLWPTRDQGIELPSFLEFVYDVKSLFYLPLGLGLTGSGNDNAYRVNESTPQLYAHYQRERDDTGVVSARFYVEGRKPPNALWVKGRKPYDAFAGSSDGAKDVDTTQANRYVVTNMTAASVIDDLALDAVEAEKFELARKLQERALLLRFEISHIMASMTPPTPKTITTPFTRKRI